jgi:hypothetical protein
LAFAATRAASPVTFNVGLHNTVTLVALIIGSSSSSLPLQEPRGCVTVAARPDAAVNRPDRRV